MRIKASPSIFPEEDGEYYLTLDFTDSYKLNISQVMTSCTFQKQNVNLPVK